MTRPRRPPAAPLDPGPAARRELARLVRRVLRANGVRDWTAAVLWYTRDGGSPNAMMPVVTRRRRPSSP